MDPSEKMPSEMTTDDEEEGSLVEVADPASRYKHRNPCLRFLINNWFMLATIAGVGLGFGVAFTIRATQPGSTALTWICELPDKYKFYQIKIYNMTYLKPPPPFIIAIPADIYLRLLQLLILPLIASNVLVGMFLFRN